uniref:Cysteine dioxygenase n=1 Tax=uncultured bacterium esnapd7 TaxID=1366614 RepID=S5UC70_9BACT|nr:cysteine dioxygenase [uncultured bacterium esnapd7]
MFAVPENTLPLLSAPLVRHPLRVAADLARDEERWRAQVRFDPVERFVLLLERTDQYEAWLLTWSPGQGTDPHHHGSATGTFVVVAGVLTERMIRGAETLLLRAGQSRVFAPGYSHQVTNTGHEPAVSIHVYRPARRLHSHP